MMGIFRTLLLIALGAAAFGFLLATLGVGNQIPLVNLLLMGIPGAIVGLAAGASPTPVTKRKKSIVRGAADGSLLAATIALIGGAVVAFIALSGVVNVAGGQVVDTGEQFARAALIPGIVYFVVGLVFGLLGAMLGRLGGGRGPRK